MSLQLWRDLGFSEKEAQRLDLKSEHFMEISDFVEKRNMSDWEAARFFHVSHFVFQHIRKGNMSKISDFRLYLLSRDIKRHNNKQKEIQETDVARCKALVKILGDKFNPALDESFLHKLDKIKWQN